MTVFSYSKTWICTLCILALSACSAENEQTANTASSAPKAASNVSASAPNTNTTEALPIPRIPEITIPDFIGVTEQQLTFEQAMPPQLKTMAGIKVYPARCDNQQLISSNGSLTQYSVSFCSPHSSCTEPLEEAKEELRSSFVERQTSRTASSSL